MALLQIENRRGLGGAAFLPVVDHTDQEVRTRPITVGDGFLLRRAAAWICFEILLERWNAASPIVGLISTWLASNPDLRQLVA